MRRIVVQYTQNTQEKQNEKGKKMKIITVKNYDEMSALAAEIICQEVRNNPFATLGLATGSTVLGVYDALIQKCAAGQVTFRNVKAVNLDEYVGLDGNHKQSYAYYMRHNLYDRIDIELMNTFIPCGTAEDLLDECDGYNNMLDVIPRDLQLLGIGSDGHIAFNEPDSPFESRTRVVQLHPSTVKDNSRLFERIEDVPQSAISMGIADIMSAKKLLLLASGSSKAQAVKDMVHGAVCEACPASILQRHPDAIVIVDELAAALL